MNLLRYIFLFSLISFISFASYCASKNGWLPLVHGPYYFSIAKSLFHYNEINQFAIYPPVQSLVYTLQIGISFFEYLIFQITEKYWYILFYSITSLIWLINFIEFSKFKTSIFNKIDRYLLFSIFFLQPYNLNQLGNFSNEALYFPCLLYFFFSFFRVFTSSSNKVKNIYIFTFSIFIIFGVYFRLHHVILCINFFIFSFFIKNIRLSVGLLLLGILNIVVFFLIIKNTYLNFVFFEHLDYFNNNISVKPDSGLLESFGNLIEKFFVIITYPLLLTKFTNNIYIYYLFGIFILFLMSLGFREIRKNNKLFNYYSIIYFVLSTIFVMLLPPFEYSYILPFSFIIFTYSFAGFKILFPKFYVHFFKAALLIGTIFVVVSYLFINSSLIEGHEYRNFIRDLKKNYIIEHQDMGVFYLANDAHDHFEDFYWQNKKKEPYCQIKIVTISECKKIQQKVDDKFIYIVGKNIENLSKEYGFILNENFNLDSDVKPFLKSLISSFNQNHNEKYILDKIYKSQYFYYILLRKNSLPKNYVFK